MKHREELNKLKLYSKNIALTSQEKDALLQTLTSFSESHVVGVVKSPDIFVPQSFFSGKKGLFVEFSAICLVTLLITSGTSFAASYALPGDPLYPIKVNVNEQVKGLFVADKATWQLERVQLRLQEAEKLVVEGKFNAKTSAQVQAHLDVTTTDVKNQISQLAENSDLDKAASIATDLEASLSAHQDVIVQLTNQSTSTVKDALISLSEKVNTEIQTASTTESSLADKIAIKAVNTDSATASAKFASVTEKISALKSLLSQNDIRNNSAINAEASAGITSAENLTTQGKIKLDAGDYTNAYILFQQAQKTAGRVKTLATVGATISVALDGNLHAGATAMLKMGTSTASTTPSNPSKKNDATDVVATSTSATDPVVSTDDENDAQASSTVSTEATLLKTIKK